MGTPLGLPPVQLTGGRASGSGRVSDVVNWLKLDRSEPSESALPSLAVVSLLDPGESPEVLCRLPMGLVLGVEAGVAVRLVLVGRDHPTDECSLLQLYQSTQAAVANST